MRPGQCHTPQCSAGSPCGPRRSLAPPLLSRPDQIADLHGRDWQRVDLDAERTEGVLDRRGERRRYAHPPAFTPALNAILCERRRRHDVADLDIRWRLLEGGDEVVGKVGGYELALLVVVEVLVHRRADSLHRPTAHVPGERHRVDDRTAVVDRDVLQERYLAGLDIDLDDRDMTHVAHDRVEHTKVGA